MSLQLKYSSVYESEQSLLALLRKARNLKRLHLTFENNSVLHLPLNVASVEELVFDGNGKNYFLDGSLESWDFPNLTQLEWNDIGIDTFVRTVLPERCPQLRSLKIHSPGTRVDRDINNSALLSWISKFRNIETLHFHHSLDRESYLETVERHASTLRALHVIEDMYPRIVYADDEYLRHASRLLEMSEPFQCLRELTLGIGPDFLSVGSTLFASIGLFAIR